MDRQTIVSRGVIRHHSAELHSRGQCRPHAPSRLSISSRHPARQGGSRAFALPMAIRHSAKAREPPRQAQWRN